jgi:hypothetical protein
VVCPGVGRARRYNNRPGVPATWNPYPSRRRSPSRAATASRSSVAAIRSMIGLAARPGTDVLPTCSIVLNSPGGAVVSSAWNAASTLDRQVRRQKRFGLPSATGPKPRRPEVWPSRSGACGVLAAKDACSPVCSRLRTFSVLAGILVPCGPTCGPNWSHRAHLHEAFDTLTRPVVAEALCRASACTYARSCFHLKSGRSAVRSRPSPRADLRRRALCDRASTLRIETKAI